MINLFSTIILILTVIIYLCVGLLVCMKGASKISKLLEKGFTEITIEAKKTRKAFIIIGIAFILFFLTLCMPGLLINLFSMTPAEFSRFDLTVIRTIRLIAVLFEISGLLLLLNAFKKNP